MRVTVWGAIVAIVGTSAMNGCAEDAAKIDGANVTRVESRLSEVTVAGQRYLPHGTKVSPSDTLRLLPPPYDPRIDGPLAQGIGVTRVNLATVPRITRDLPRRAGGSPPVFTDGNAALFLLAGRGVYASVSAGYDISIPPQYANSLRLYAPTHLPHGGSCLEVSSVHWRVGLPYVNNMIGIWDWCIPGAQNFAAFLNMDDIFTRMKYIHAYTDEFGKTRQVYMLYVFASNPSGANYSYDTWTMVLYNFMSGQWEALYSQDGIAVDLSQIENGDPKGWSMWESKGLPSAGCPTFPSQTAQNIQIRVGTNWQMPTDEATQVTPTYSGCGYTWIRPWGNNYGWFGLTPNW